MKKTSPLCVKIDMLILNPTEKRGLDVLSIVHLFLRHVADTPFIVDFWDQNNPKRRERLISAATQMLAQEMEKDPTVGGRVNLSPDLKKRVDEFIKNAAAAVAENTSGPEEKQ